ncbi:MAG: hypothetical protein IKU24_00885 [Clostridia bacterium]|nr:hypothetical protein [Clostridia bacterium]
MMKKFFSLILALSCLAFLFSCSETRSANSTNEAFSPLFRFTVKEGTSDETRLFYLEESEGFLYLHHGEEGLTGGFVSPKRSLSAESLFHISGDLSSVSVWEKEKDFAVLLSSEKLYITKLNEKGILETPLPEGFSADGVFPLDPLSFAAKKDSLLLVHPIDLKETYVLADTSLLTDFSHLITTSGEGKFLWYAKQDEGGNYTGIAAFEYGKNIPLGEEKFSFDSVLSLGDGALLFTRKLQDGKSLYTYRNLNTKEAYSKTTSILFEGVIASETGEILCGSETVDQGGKIHVIDLKKGREKGSYPVEYGKIAPSLAVDKKGETLLFAVGQGSDEILGTLDLKRF